jgi:hypothetical protein
MDTVQRTVSPKLKTMKMEIEARKFILKLDYSNPLNLGFQHNGQQQSATSLWVYGFKLCKYTLVTWPPGLSLCCVT